MKLSLIKILACPVCGGDLKLSGPEETDIIQGALECASCRHRYQISEGIPRLRPPQDIPADAAKTRESFGWEWLRYPGSRPLDEGVFLEETMMARDSFAGKLVLDAGCGMGRYSAVACALGAEVVAVDMSESLIRVAEAAKSNPRLHPVEADLLHPPFKKKVFDLAYSQGVLHHTADTHAAFQAVAALVKVGGSLSVWLYGRAGQSMRRRSASTAAY
jgi:SAM-dependent methyltransferase